jgi:hypothetical protein
LPEKPVLPVLCQSFEVCRPAQHPGQERGVIIIAPTPTLNTRAGVRRQRRA